MKSLKGYLGSPTALIVMILAGFAGIVALQTYADNHHQDLTGKKTEAQQLIGSWEAFEAATNGLLTTEDLPDAIAQWATTARAFDQGLKHLAQSDALQSLSSTNVDVRESIVLINDLWSFIEFRTEHTQKYLHKIARRNEFGNSHHRQGLLLTVGYLVGQGAPDADYLALYSQTNDIGFIVSSSGDFLVAALSVIVEHITLHVDHETQNVRLITLFLSTLIIALVIFTVVQSQKALLSSEQRYRSLQNNLPLGVYRSSRDGCLLSVNPAMVEMFGYESESEMLSVAAPDLYFVPERRKELAVLLSATGRGTDLESRMRRKDGSVFWVSSNAHAVMDESGQVVHYDGILEDITGRKEVEVREQAAAREKYVQAKRISGVFAHEIRNALFPARAALNRLKLSVNGSSYDEGTRKFASIAERAVSNATATTRLISDFNKLDTEVMPQKVEFADVMQDFIETNRMRLEDKEVTLEVSGDPDVCVKSNRLQLPLVFNNLLSNSLHALDGRPDPRISVTTSRNGEFLELTFEDNGCGIAVGDHRRVFEPFYSTKAHRDGIGIGLSTSRKIMNMYGGTISVSSTEGKGTRFDLRLKICTEND